MRFAWRWPILLSVLLSVWVAIPRLTAYAEPASFSQKPIFKGKADFVMPWYIQLAKQDIADRDAEITEDLARLQQQIESGEVEQRDPYDRGSNDYWTNFWHDFGVMHNNFFQCAEPRWIGYCIRTTYPFDIGQFWQYYLPKQKVENVDQQFKSGYFPEPMQEAHIAMLDNSSSPASHYFYAPGEVVNSVKMGVNRADEFGNRWFGYKPLPKADLAKLKEEKGIIEKLQDEFDTDIRFRNPAGKVRFNEYHVMPTYFEETAEVFAPWLFWGWGGNRNHVKLFGGYFSSDWPGTKIPSTFARFSYFPFIIEMLELYGLPGSGKFGFPLSCTGYNMRKGMSNPLGGYIWQTPQDLLLQLPDKKGFNTRLWLSPGRGCLGYNQGNWVPATISMHQPYAPPAAAVGTVKGIKMAHKGLQMSAMGGGPAMFYDVSFKRDLRHRDKFQWARSNKMLEETGGACMEPEQFITAYGDGIQRGHAVKDHGDWNVIIHWRKFRVCPSGMVPIWPFDGDFTTIYK